MPKKILLIDNDQALAGRLSETLEGAGFAVRATGDGKEGLELARDWTPEAIVLCVELPSMSGYLVCQKLKKDDALKGIPLVLTSAEATEETFEKHRTLKARADAYLLKPYEPEALLEKLGALVGLPEPTAPPLAIVDSEEELIDLEAEMGLDSAEGEPDGEVPGLALESLPDEGGIDAGSSSVDDDLRLLDDAFDGISAPPPAQEAAAALDELTGETQMTPDEVDAAAASLAEEEALPADLGSLDDEAEAALGALGEIDETLSPGLALGATPPQPPVRGASADLLRAAGIKLLEDEASEAGAPAAGEAGGGADAALLAELREARDALDARGKEVAALRRDVEAQTRRAGAAEGELAESRSRADAALEKARKAEADAKAARDEARGSAEQARAAEGQLAELRRKAADADERAAAGQEALREAEAVAADAAGRAEALERAAEQIRTELLVARGEADGARAEVERRTADLKKRVAELEAANAKNEERVVKAYQKIKADEKVRDKVRKALAIATQLLEEGLPSESAAEKERRAAASGRE